MIRLRKALIQLLALGLGAAAAAWQRPQPAPTPAAALNPSLAPLAPPAQAGGPVLAAPAIVKPRPEFPFPVGKTYVYGSMWRVFHAGTATLRMEQAGAQNRVLGTANAMSSVALLYHVQDRYESFFDPATFCSRSISRHIEEGVRQVDTSIAFDYARSKSLLDQKNLKKKEHKHEEHAIPNCVTDVLTAIYYTGTLPLQPGQVYSFPLNDGGETLYVNVHAQAREQIKTPAGTFNTIRVQPETSSGLLKSKGKIWIWYSDDAARVPVQARAHFYWGTLTFTLQRIDRK